MRANSQDPLVLSLPCRVLRDEETLQFNILMYFSRCSHYLSLRGALCIFDETKTTTIQLLCNSIGQVFVVFNRESFQPKPKQSNPFR